MSKSSDDPSIPFDSGEIKAFISTKSVTPRLASIDAYRGLVMFLMMAEVLKLCQVARNLPGQRIWELLCHHQSHVEWVGCSLHDLIQPSFSFLVGVALPFSLANRLAKGQSKAWLTAHALWRSLILVLLGVFLRSRHQSQTYYTFEDTLSQIGLGYTFLFVLALFSGTHSVDRRRCHPGRLLGGFRAVSGSRKRLRFRFSQCQARLAASPDRVRRPLG